MHATFLAMGITDNSPGGYYLTFLFPMLLFIFVSGALYVIFTRPHTVPGHGRIAAQTAAAGAATPVPESGSARAAAVATGFTTAEGGGARTSQAEPFGAHRAAGQGDQAGAESGGEPDSDQTIVADDGPAKGDPEASE